MPRKYSRSYLISHILRVLPSRRVTIDFPYGPLELPESFRGQVIVDISRCAGCGICMRDCPTGAITVERLLDKGVCVRHRYDMCATCGQCELACPEQAIVLAPSYCPPSRSRDDLCHEWTREGPRGDE